MRGTIPAELQEIVNELLKPKPRIFDWKAYFRRMLGSIYDINIKKTRRKESVRFPGSAGIKHKKKVSILVAVDTSGSVSNEELEDFFSEITYIYKVGTRITILECDARISANYEYTGKWNGKVHGRGGTDFQPVIDYYRNNKKDYASLIYFTDGECCIPENVPMDTIWVITSEGDHNKEYPGRTLFIVDVSGSMMCPISGRSGFNRLDVASAMAMLAANQCEDFELVLTAGNDCSCVGQHEYVRYPKKGFGLCNTIKERKDHLGGGGIFTRQCLEWCEQTFDGKFDRIIVFSDSQDCDRINKIPKPFKYIQQLIT